MKKFISFFIALILIISTITACSQNKADPIKQSSQDTGDKLNIVTTIFPNMILQGRLQKIKLK